MVITYSKKRHASQTDAGMLDSKTDERSVDASFLLEVTHDDIK